MKELGSDHLDRYQSGICTIIQNFKVVHDLYSPKSIFPNHPAAEIMLNPSAPAHP